MSLFFNLFKSKQRRQLEKRVLNETKHVQSCLNDVFSRNNNYFLQSGKISIAFDLVLSKPPRDVSGLFLLGVAMEAVQPMPQLPTAPYDRAFLHIFKFWAETDELIEEARIRMVTVREQFESLDPPTSFVVSEGRSALRGGGEDHLLLCYEGVYRYAMINMQL